VPQSAMGAVFPALAMLSRGDHRRLAFAYEKSYKMLAIVALPLAVGIAITAASIVHLTRGFEQSIPALQLLAPSIALLFVNNAFIYTLTAINRQADFTRLALATLVVNLVLNAALIPPFGYLGAAAASTLTELALFAGGWWLLRRHLTALPLIRSIGPVLISVAIMGAAVYLVRSFSLLLVVPLAVVIYLGGLLVFRALNAEELSILRASFSNR
jgi:O-antigen/teichoic acid export membrane protein